MRAALIYPHQLYLKHPAVGGADLCVLVEEPLFFTQYPFHAKKLILHRASMLQFAKQLRKQGEQVRYIECHEIGSTGAIGELLFQLDVKEVFFVDPCDDWLRTRLIASLEKAKLNFRELADPHFLTPEAVFRDYAQGRKKLFFADFYSFQRKRLEVLVEENGKPIGGKWSFDHENRQKIPRGFVIPPIAWPAAAPDVADAREYVVANFGRTVGIVDQFRYPTNHCQAAKWLEDFLDQRLDKFGQYEDAICANEAFLFHSVLTPILNIGLLSPRQVLSAALARADDVPLNSLEGFVRQIIGWREYIRGVYLTHGRRQRSRNFWNHHQPMPAAFYDGTTGVEPVDAVVNRVLEHGYCHHIERLMILGNFMLLCEIDPNAIYQWFMELFVDSYDWVMVPNVYGMSQHSDGGLITTKPYISASSYVMKMSNFGKGPWCAVWDALYWRFIAKHREFFAKNPRMSMMIGQLDKMGSRLCEHQETAEAFLSELHVGKNN